MEKPSIGILAGMGPRSTGPFIDMVVTECQRQYGARDDIDFPKMMICSQPAPFYEDRPVDHVALEEAIREGLLDLERTGVDFLAIACNTAHIYYPQLARSVKVPLLNMVEIALEALPGDTRKLALVAARPTVESEVYQAGIRARGLPLFEPEWQSEVDHLLGMTRTSATPAEFALQWGRLTEVALAGGVDTLLVACLDLSAVIAHAKTDLRIVDAAECLAKETVRQWRLLSSRPGDLRRLAEASGGS